jgi:beta-glucosidase
VPADADVIVTRLTAPYDPRDRYLLESAFHAGSLEFTADDVERLRILSLSAPVIVVIHLERPALLAPLLPHSAAVLAVYGSSDAAVLEALATEGAARGVLPFDVPRSLDEIVAARSDVPGDTSSPLFRAGV